MTDLTENITKRIQKITNLSEGLEPGDKFIDELLIKLGTIEDKLLHILKEDERRKAQKKAS